MFSSNGIDQRKADLVMRGEPYLISVGGDAADTWDLTGRTSVDPSTIGPSINIVPLISQSTNQNGVNAALAPFTLTNPNHVYNGSIAHPVTPIYRAKEPLLVSDLVSGNHFMNLADALVTDGAVANVVIWNAAFGGSWMASWSPTGGFRGDGTGTGSVATPGDAAWRIGLAARSIFNAGLWNNPTVIDCQIGPWDTDVATKQTDCQNALTNAIAECKRVGLLRAGNVMFVHLETRISGLTASRNAVRAAQAAVCDGVLTRLGADTDTIDGSHRYDGTHDNTSGAAARSALKKPFYENFLANG